MTFSLFLLKVKVFCFEICFLSLYALVSLCAYIGLCYSLTFFSRVFGHLPFFLIKERREDTRFSRFLKEI